MTRADHRYLPGLVLAVDPGTRTGLARVHRNTSAGPGEPAYVWAALECLPLHRALLTVWETVTEAAQVDERVLVVVEDARQIGAWGASKDRGASLARAQGAGSIKRDCAIWQEALDDLRRECGPDLLRLNFVRPAGGPFRKLSQADLLLRTGCPLTGNAHARDAAGLLWAYFLSQHNRNL